MDAKYFKSVETSGNVYVQLRYFSSSTGKNNYHALIILISSSGHPQEFVEIYSKSDLDFFMKYYLPSNQDEFHEIQDTMILGGKAGSRKQIYDLYYNHWKDFHLLKQKAISNVNAAMSQTNTFDFYDRLASEYNALGVNNKRDAVLSVEKSVELQPCFSLMDIYREARHNATLDYTTNRF